MVKKIEDNLAIERVDDDTPEEIRYLFEFPYRYFSTRTGGCSVLDISCGNFHQRSILAKSFRSVLGADISPQKPGIIQASLQDIPLVDNSIDVIFCFETLEHMNKELQIKAIAELDRVARLRVVIGSVSKYGCDFFENVEIYKGDKNPYHVEELSMLDMISLVNGCGFLYDQAYVSIAEGADMSSKRLTMFPFTKQEYPENSHLCNYVSWNPST